MTSRRSVVAMVAATICWGSSVVTIKVASRGLSTWAVTGIELATTVVILIGVVLVRRLPLRRPSWTLALAGILEPTLAYTLINGGLARTSGTHGSIIIGSQSLLVVVMSSLLHRKVPSRRVFVGLALALTGLVAVTATRSSGAPTALGDAMVFIGVLCGAGYVVLAHGLADRYDAIEFTFYQFAFGTVALVPVLALALHQAHRSVLGGASTGEVAAAFATGVVGSALGFLLYNTSLQGISPAAAGIGLTLIPFFGVVFSAIFLGEAVTLGIVVGGILVIAGVSLSSMSPSSPMP
jgi:drug/metabolite transporter (DMT)-like permease